MKREFLKGLGLPEDTINTIMAEYGKSIEEYKNEVDRLQNDLDGKNAIIKTNTADFDNRVNEEVKKIQHKLLIDNAINNKFKDVDPAVSELLKTQINKDLIKVDEKGDVTGLDDQFTSLQTKYKSLLEKKNEDEKVESSGVPTGKTPNPSNDLESLSYEEYVKARKKENN